MADSLETLILDILTRDRASDDLSKIGARAEDASLQTDKLNKRLDELGRKSATARVKLDGDKDAALSLDKINAKLLGIDRRVSNPKITVEGVAKATAELAALDAELNNLGKKGGSADSAGLSLSSLGSAAMPALIGSAVALSPVIATLGVGFGGLAAAAASTISPVLQAGTATAAQRKELALLNPAQRAVYDSLGGLRTQFQLFTKSLQPQVLTIFNDGVQLAGQLLHDVQPVAAATGTAFGTFIGQLGKTFGSQQFQQFFTWMAQNAAPDMQMLGAVIIDLTADLPPLLEGLQPVATMLLQTADDALVVTGAFEKLTTYTLQQAAAFKSVQKSTGPSFLNIPVLGPLIAHLTGFTSALNDTTGQTPPRLHAVATAADTATSHLKSLAQQVSDVTSAESKAISPLLAYTNALLTQISDEGKFQDALKKSRDMVGLKTAAERASLAASQAYIQDLLNTSAAAVKANKGISGQIGILEAAIPVLERAKGQTADYRQEIADLRAELARLENIKVIDIILNLITRHTTGPGGPPVPYGYHPPTLAAGGMVRGGTPGRDSVLGILMPGEVVVPAPMVRAGAVDHLRGRLPGFGSGGMVSAPAAAPVVVNNFTVNVAVPVGASTAETGRQIAAALAPYIKAGGRLYPAGTQPR